MAAVHCVCCHDTFAGRRGAGLASVSPYATINWRPTQIGRCCPARRRDVAHSADLPMEFGRRYMCGTPHGRGILDRRCRSLPAVRAACRCPQPGPDWTAEDMDPLVPARQGQKNVYNRCIGLQNRTLDIKKNILSHYTRVLTVESNPPDRSASAVHRWSRPDGRIS
jgi:hypothetical protein